MNLPLSWMDRLIQIITDMEPSFHKSRFSDFGISENRGTCMEMVKGATLFHTSKKITIISEVFAVKKLPIRSNFHIVIYIIFMSVTHQSHTSQPAQIGSKNESDFDATI